MIKEIRKELKLIWLSTYYALQREMLNKISFLSSVVFMILNDACFIVEWLVIFALKSDINGFSFKEVLLLWGLSAGMYGFSRFSFKKAFSISNTIVDGSLDAYLVQPKNVLISVISSDVSASAFGDIIYAYIILIFYGLTFYNFILFTLFCILGAILQISVSVIYGSLSFWLRNSDVIEDQSEHLMVSFSTYPESIFKGFIKVLFFTILPVGYTTFLPARLILNFDIKVMLALVVIDMLFTILAVGIFYKGLKKYSSSSLMTARV